MPVFIFLAIWMLLELYVIILVGDAIGALLTIVLLIAGFVIGATLIKRQLFKFQMKVMQMQSAGMMQQNTLKNGEGMFAILAGFLFLIPGFITDLLAICLLFPLIRNILGTILLKLFKPDVMVSRFTKKQPNNVYEHVVKTYAKKEDGTAINGEFIEHNKK